MGEGGRDSIGRGDQESLGPGTRERRQAVTENSTVHASCVFFSFPSEFSFIFSTIPFENDHLSVLRENRKWQTACASAGIIYDDQGHLYGRKETRMKAAFKSL